MQALISSSIHNNSLNQGYFLTSECKYGRKNTAEHDLSPQSLQYINLLATF